MAKVLTNGGAAYLANLLDSSYWIGWGTGVGTSDVSFVVLHTESTEPRIAATVNISGNTLRVVGLMTADADKSITNAGVFSASTGGTLITMVDFISQPLEEGDGINFTFLLPVINVTD